MKKEKVKVKTVGKINTHEGTYRDIKRMAVSLGMPFPDVVEADVHGLLSYIDHTSNKPDLALIDQFDNWSDIQLEEAGYPKAQGIRHPNLRLGFLREDEEGQVKVKRVKGLKREKKKRELDQHGLVAFTKKSYTYSLKDKGLSPERIIRRVTHKFPDASEKSIKICMRQWETKKKNS